MSWYDFDNPAYKIKILDFTYTSQPSINTAIPLKKNTFKLVLFYIGIILSAGFLWLLSKWSKKRLALFTSVICHLEEATYFLISDEDVGGEMIIVNKFEKYEVKIKRNCIAFSYHDRNYMYIEQKQVFVPVRYEQLGIHLDRLKKDKFVPNSQENRAVLLEYYGQNVMRLEIQSILQIFIQEMLTPYQVFQTYGIILWIYEEYYVFAFVLLFYSLYMYWTNANNIKKTQQKLAFESYFDVQCKVLISDNGEQRIIQNLQVELCKNRINVDEHKSEIMNQQFNQIDSHDKAEIQATILKRRVSKQVKNNENFLINNKNISYKSVSSHKLVPGDIIILNEADIVPCDCILLRGQSLVNQKYSSGQDYLVRKEQIQNFTYTRQNQRNFVLYLGTEIVKIKSNLSGSSDSQLICLVINTNYNTLRGKYLRAIRYQGKHQQNFFRQTIYYIYIIILITTAAYLICLTTLGSFGRTGKLFQLYIDLLITAIPPTLPTILNVGVQFVLHRLKNHGINCVLPKSALAGGKVNTIILKGQEVFGKQFSIQSAAIGHKKDRGFGLNFSSVEQFNSYLSREVSFLDLTQLGKKQSEKKQFEKTGKYFLCALASCHTLEYYKRELHGSQFQRKIYEFSQARLQTHNNYITDDYIVNVQKTIRLRTKTNKTGVIVTLQDRNPSIETNKQNNLYIEQQSLLDEHNVTKKYHIQQQIEHKPSKKIVFVKGAPQKILSHCLKDTFPQNAYDYIVDMAQKGFNLFCYAMLFLEDTDKIDYVELLNRPNYIFLGFIILQQKREVANTEAIKALLSADIKLLYISEQRELEAVSKAVYNGICSKNKLIMCNINKDHEKIFCKGHIQWQSSASLAIGQFISQFQQFGKQSRVSLSSQLYEELYMRNDLESTQNIFSKLSILNKTQLKHYKNLYSQIQKRGWVSCSVGNSSVLTQCGGLSLQLQREQGAFLSSFNTKNSNLSVIVTCLRVCRAGLSTNFHCFNMMILFTLTQMTSCAILNMHFQNLSNLQTLYEDLFITFPIFVTLNLTLPSSKLSKQLPPSSFFSFKYILSTFGQLIIQLIVQVSFVAYVQTFEQFSSQNKNSKDFYKANSDFYTGGVLSAALFVLTNNLYLGIVLSTSVSKPFRKPFYTNPYYTLNIILLWCYNTCIVVFPRLSPDDMQPKSVNQKSEFVLILALILGNLVMLLMYMYQNLLVFIWSHGINCFKNRRLSQNSIREHQLMT